MEQAPYRLGKHSTPPFTGKCRIVGNSGLRKLMRAARRGLVPAERLRVIVQAQMVAHEQQARDQARNYPRVGA